MSFKFIFLSAANENLCRTSGSGVCCRFADAADRQQRQLCGQLCDARCSVLEHSGNVSDAAVWICNRTEYHLVMDQQRPPEGAACKLTGKHITRYSLTSLYKCFPIFRAGYVVDLENTHKNREIYRSKYYPHIIGLSFHVWPVQSFSAGVEFR